jgi:Protein of unknown function (DUF3616)
VSPSRFVFIDNAYPWALFELNLNPGGREQGPIVPRPIVGLGPSGLSDAEGIARIDVEGAIDLILASSLGFRGVDTSGKAIVHNGLARIRYGADGDLHAEVMRGFRDWLITGHPELAAAARLLRDKDGLNIEGLAWDPSRRALLFGLRSPVNVGRIPVLSVLLDTGAPWTTAALQIGPQLAIDKSGFPAPQGIRDIDYHAARQELLVLVGRSISGATRRSSCAPGTVRRRG